MQVHLHKGKGGGDGSSTGACRYVDLIGKLQEIIYTSPCSADTTELVLAFIWQVLCPFRNHAIYLCHREFAPWQNGSVVSSTATQCRCSQVQVPQHANYFGSDGIRWDWIGLDYPNVFN
jgi:hypothetical protein